MCSRFCADADLQLLAQVVRHKTTFYPAAWARYDLAVPGSLQLMPPDYRLNALRQDYREISVMIFREPPPFASVFDRLSALPAGINGMG